MRIFLSGLVILGLVGLFGKNSYFYKQPSSITNEEEQYSYVESGSYCTEEEEEAELEKSGKKITINASAYTAAADECGKSDGITASGNKVKENHTLACPPNYKFGTKIFIKDMGEYVCEDRGGAIKGNHFDIYMKTKQEAFQFGRRNLTAYVIG